MRALILFLLGICPFILLAQDTVVLRPGAEGKDALIWNYSPVTNYGDIPKFVAMSWTHSGTPGIDRSLIDFDLSSIPDGKVILDARLDLFHVDLEPNILYHSGENMAALSLITQAWDESTVSWNNAPSITEIGQVILPQHSFPTQDYLNIDVTNLIELLYENPMTYHGIMLRLLVESPYRCLLFASGDYFKVEKRPRLTITYGESSTLTALFTYEILNDSVVKFENLSSNATDYSWEFGDGQYSAEAHPTHIYPQFGWFKVCLTARRDDLQAAHCENIKICFLPTPTFTFENQEDNIQFISGNPASIPHFWDFGDGYYSGIVNPVHHYETDGIYEVSLRLGDEQCFIEHVEQISFSLENSDQLLIWVLPNPSEGGVNISAPESGLLKFELFDVRGALLFSEERAVLKRNPEYYFFKVMSGSYYARLQLNQHRVTAKLVFLND